VCNSLSANKCESQVMNAPQPRTVFYGSDLRVGDEDSMAHYAHKLIYVHCSSWGVQYQQDRLYPVVVPFTPRYDGFAYRDP